MGELSPWHWAIVILVLVLLFGARRLPDAARSLGRSARILKSELRADSETQTESETPAGPESRTAAETRPEVTPPAPQQASPQQATPQQSAPSTPETNGSSVTTSQTTPRRN